MWTCRQVEQALNVPRPPWPRSAGSVPLASPRGGAAPLPSRPARGKQEWWSSPPPSVPTHPPRLPWPAGARQAGVVEFPMFPPPSAGAHVCALAGRRSQLSMFANRLNGPVVMIAARSARWSSLSAFCFPNHGPGTAGRARQSKPAEHGPVTPAQYLHAGGSSSLIESAPDIRVWTKLNLS